MASTTARRVTEGAMVSRIWLPPGARAHTGCAVTALLFIPGRTSPAHWPRCCQQKCALARSQTSAQELLTEGIDRQSLLPAPPGGSLGWGTTAAGDPDRTFALEFCTA